MAYTNLPGYKISGSGQAALGLPNQDSIPDSPAGTIPALSEAALKNPQFSTSDTFKVDNMSTGRYTDVFTSCNNSTPFPWWYEVRNSAQFLHFLEK